MREDMRYNALVLANGFSADKTETPEQVVDRATTYFNFLSPNDKVEEEPAEVTK
jgi:hypothetical protein